jgi:hypothetical protein
VAIVLVVNTSRAADPLAPVPPAPAVTAAEKVIRDVYKADYAKKKTADQLELAWKLLKAGEATTNDPTNRYTLFQEARTIAIKAGDVALALSAADATCREFEVNHADLTITTLEAAAKGSSPTTVVEIALDEVEHQIQADNYPTASRFLKVAAAAAGRANSPTLTAAVAAKMKEVEATQKALEATEPERKVLAKTPDDPIAAARVGRFLCLIKGDWQAGLPLLAKGEDEKLKAAVLKDLARPSDALAKVDVADSWYDLGEGFDPRERTQARMRSLLWYQQAAPSLTGICQRSRR